MRYAITEKKLNTTFKKKTIKIYQQKNNWPESQLDLNLKFFLINFTASIVLNGISLNNLNSSNRKMFENLVFTKKYNFMGHALRGNFMNI